MVAVLLRLKLRLVADSFRRSAWRTVGFVLGAVYALGLLVGWGFGAWAASAGGPQELTWATVGALGLAGMAWLVGVVLVFGVDETLDPSKFALLPLPARRLMPGLLVAGLVDVPGAAAAGAVVIATIAWLPHGLPAFAAALLAYPVGLATTLLVVRVVTSGLAGMLTSRRFRDLAAVLLGVVALVATVFGNLLGRVADGGGRPPTAVIDAFSWTPFGLPWALPGDVAAGDGRAAAVRAGLLLGLLVLLWWAWRVLLDRAMTTPPAGSGGGGTVSASPLLDRVGAVGPAAAVAARCLRYWRRDPRYLSGLLGVVLLPIVLLLPTLTSGEGVSGGWLRAGVGLLAVSVGTSVAADISYDSSALWTHVSTGISGAADRAGRVLAHVVVFAPLLAACVVADGMLTDAAHAVGTAALAVALLLAGLGVGAYVGAVLQGVVPQPGESAFSKGSGSGLVNLVVHLASLLGALLVGLPSIVILLIGGDSLGPVLGSLASGLVLGAVALVVGVRAGGRRLDRSWPEVLDRVSPKA